MTIEPPQPPTAPAPAVRPTPPTPPRIDKTPFARNEQAADDSHTGDDQQAGNSEQQAADDAEAMAREAVANGSGPLTKRTVNRTGDERQAQPPANRTGDERQAQPPANRTGDERQAQPPANQTVTVIPPDAPLVSEGQSDYDRGQDVLRQFRELDAGENQSGNRPALSSNEQPPPAAPHLSYDEGHGVVFWLFAIIFVAVASFVIVKKFLLTDKPALTKSQLFADSSDRLQAAADKVKPARTTSPPVKTPPPPKKDDERGKHFEVRI